jgi:hypothetical protein
MTGMEVKQTGRFTDMHSQFCKCSKDSILAVIHIRDDPIRDIGISSVEKAFNLFFRLDTSGGDRDDRVYGSRS